MRTWLITGCSTGIGCGIAKAALAAGEQVIVTTRRVETLAEFAEKYPQTALVLPLDTTNTASMEKAVHEGIQRFGQIDVLVNNAGYGYRAAIEEGEEAAVQKMFATNVFGPAKLMQLVLPQMRQRKDGIIINVSSIGAVRAPVANGYYSASKAALEMISEAADKESGHLGIHVMIVEPGAFRTNFYAALQGTKKEITDYDASVSGMRLENMVNHHDQPGDPDKAGTLLVRLVQQGTLPKRLPLGSDAIKIIRSELQRRLAEVDEVEHLSIQTDY